MRVLLAEDDRISRKMATVALEGAGYEVDAVGDGEEAWERLLADPERLLVTDWMMPNMDGVELTRRVRAGTFSSYVYVILVTALADPKSAIEGLEAGADDYLGKPYDPRELIARVNVGTRVQQLERGLRESRRQLRELVTLDPTTGLLNRASIERRAHEEAARALDAGSPLSLALVAVEGLEGVLRAHGRAAADELVRRIAASIETAFGRTTPRVAGPARRSLPASAGAATSCCSCCRDAIQRRPAESSRSYSRGSRHRPSLGVIQRRAHPPSRPA